jgi:predicted ATPase
VTSREPLRAEGEWVHRLAALEVPSASSGEDVSDVRAYPAIALFAERARAVNTAFELDAGTLGAVIEICRRLDGIPLAIELAAARSDLMDPATIASNLDDRFDLLTRGRRTALPRHQTLRAVLDWSYALLDASGRHLLDRLSLFRATFDSGVAMEMAAGAGLSPSAAREALGDLIAKSLVTSIPGPAGMRFRLLDTTRHYGLERLEERGEEREARNDHARCLVKLLGESVAAWEGKAPRTWLSTYSSYIDDTRSRLFPPNW